MQESNDPAVSQEIQYLVKWDPQTSSPTSMSCFTNEKSVG